MDGKLLPGEGIDPTSPIRRRVSNNGLDPGQTDGEGGTKIEPRPCVEAHQRAARQALSLRREMVAQATLRY
jgi:hypothetical protein